MRVSIMKDLSDRSSEGIMLKMTSDLGQMTHKVTREEALRMERQLGSALRPSGLRAERAFHERIQRDEIAACREELSELKKRLGHASARLDVLSF